MLVCRYAITGMQGQVCQAQGRYARAVSKGRYAAGMHLQVNNVAFGNVALGNVTLDKGVISISSVASLSPIFNPS